MSSKQRMVVEVQDILDAVPGSMVFGGGLFLNGSRLPVTVLTGISDNLEWDDVQEGVVWLADGWAERIAPE